MKNILKKLVVASLALVAINAYAAIDEVKVVKTFLDNSTQETTYKLKKINNNTYRLHLPVKNFGHGKWSYRGVVTIDVKRDEATAMKGEEGYWILPDGRMGKFKHDKGKLQERRNPMSMYGVKKGNEAFVGIINTLKWEYSSVVEVINGKYEIYPRFHIQDIHTKPYEDIIIDFTHFKGKDANYSAMGKAYRKYQLDRGEVKPLKERIVGNPRLKYTTESIFMKFMMASFMREGETNQNRGWHWKPEDDLQIQKFRDFDNMMNVLKKMKSMGIEKADIILTNWNWRSNGRNPICSVAEPELGGNSKCKELNALAKKLGFQVMPHILHTENYTISPAFDKNDIALDHEQQYKGYMGMGGKGFNPCFEQVFKKHILENYDRMKKLGFDAPIHIDVTSAIVPYDCHNIDHFCTRKDCAYYMNRVGLLCDAFFGGWTSESSVDSTANTLDYVLYVSAYPSYLGSAHPLLERHVPIWQLAYHGIILSNPFASTIDYNCRTRPAKGWGPTNSFLVEDSVEKTRAMRRLKCAEFGGRLSYYWNLTNDANLPDVKQAYDEYQQRKYLQLEFMEYHDELAPDVFITKYSDGSEMVSNYTDKPYKYKGKDVKPLDYVLYKPSK